MSTTIANAVGISNGNYSTGAVPTLHYTHRHAVLRFTRPNGPDVEAHPINYDELYNLKGRLLTLVDATFTDPEQRAAHKTLVWNALRDWMEDTVMQGHEHGEAIKPTVPVD